MDSEDRIRMKLGGIVSGSTEGAITNGQFVFTPEEIGVVIKSWVDIAYSYNESLMVARPMAQIDGPGLDFASQSFAKEANRSGRALLEYLRNKRDACLQQAQNCQDALDNYLGVEERTIISLNGADTGDGPQPGL